MKKTRDTRAENNIYYERIDLIDGVLNELNSQDDISNRDEDFHFVRPIN